VSDGLPGGLAEVRRNVADALLVHDPIDEDEGDAPLPQGPDIGLLLGDGRAQDDDPVGAGGFAEELGHEAGEPVRLARPPAGYAYADAPFGGPRHDPVNVVCVAPKASGHRGGGYQDFLGGFARIRFDGVSRMAQGELDRLLEGWFQALPVEIAEHGAPGHSGESDDIVDRSPFLAGYSFHEAIVTWNPASVKERTKIPTFLILIVSIISIFDTFYLIFT
jgi:hypothetical protein